MEESAIPAAMLSHQNIVQSSPVCARKWGEELTTKLYELEKDSTKARIIHNTHSTSKHPWAKGKEFISLSRDRKKAQTKYRNDPTVANKQALNDCCSALYVKYNFLKNEYFAEIANEIGTTKRKIYEYMRAKRNQKTELPSTMMLDGARVIGSHRMRVFNQHLQKNYSVDEVPLPTDAAQLSEAVNTIHETTYSHQYAGS